MEDKAAVTSGGCERYFKVDDETHIHNLDPGQDGRQKIGPAICECLSNGFETETIFPVLRPGEN